MSLVELMFRDLAVGCINGIVVACFGAPFWAAAATALIVFNIYYWSAS